MCQDGDARPASVARQVTEGRQDLNALAGALAAHYGEKDWKMWLEAAVAVVDREAAEASEDDAEWFG